MEYLKYLFQFEQDKYYPLRRIPMVIRMKLDISGIKLTIGDWSKFSREDRERLVVMPCALPDEITAFRERLLELIEACNGESVQIAPLNGKAAWMDISTVPDSVSRQIQALSQSAPTVAQWAALSDLQRFALSKLTREGHENKKLPLALKEFGLVP
jgi:hypothetical protein